MNQVIHALTQAFPWISYFNALVFLPTNILTLSRGTFKFSQRLRLHEKWLRKHKKPK
jgi:hypothetical protein